MTDFKLEAQSAFSTPPQNFDGIDIAAIEDRSIVSIATSNGGADTLDSAIRSAFQIDVLPICSSSKSATNNTCFLRLAQDQMFALFDQPATGSPTPIVAKALGETAYLTDQSDSWAALRVQGPKTRAVLERICTLDLNPEQFTPGSVARTMMEHLSVILLCEDPETYILLSARSSADDFLEAIETSARNVT